jgi:hypothetical protein
MPAEDPLLIPARLAELAHGLNLATPAEPIGVALARLRAALADSAIDPEEAMQQATASRRSSISALTG